jgi:acylphosphatase
MMKHFNIIVSGNVQGVFFRASARDVANQLKIKGYAQNKPDGSVYLEAEGEEEPLNQFVAWCRQGPPRAEVTNLSVTEAALHNFTAFEIRR